MDVAGLYERLKKVVDLANHPGTPTTEAESARGIADALEAKIRALGASNIKSEASAKSKGKKRVWRVDTGGRRLSFPIKWPFGWGVRGSVEIETEYSEADGVLSMGWKCPSCGAQVERIASRRLLRRLLVGSAGVLDFVEKIRVGEYNQLCDKCMREYE